MTFTYLTRDCFNVSIDNCPFLKWLSCYSKGRLSNIVHMNWYILLLPCAACVNTDMPVVDGESEGILIWGSRHHALIKPGQCDVQRFISRQCLPLCGRKNTKKNTLWWTNGPRGYQQSASFLWQIAEGQHLSPSPTRNECTQTSITSTSAMYHCWVPSLFNTINHSVVCDRNYICSM